jgi:hypothetical protein
VQLPFAEGEPEDELDEEEDDALDDERSWQDPEMQLSAPAHSALLVQLSPRLPAAPLTT